MGRGARARSQRVHAGPFRPCAGRNGQQEVVAYGGQVISDSSIGFLVAD